MLTQSDIRQLKGIFVTKNEFSEAVEDIVELMKVFRQDAKQELQDFRDEFTEFRKEVGSILRNHEGRIEGLEDKSFS